MLYRPLFRSLERPLTAQLQQPLSGFSPLSLFANGEQGAWYDPSDLNTLFQDNFGITSVSVAAQSIGLCLDKRFNLARGPELKGQGVTGLTGTAPAASYDSVAGDGSVSRGADANNQSYVQFSGLSPSTAHEVLLTVTGATSILVRSGTHVGATGTPLATGSRRIIMNSSAAGLITITTDSANGVTATFTGLSIRQVPGNHASQGTAGLRPAFRTGPSRIDYDGIDDVLNTAFPVSLGSNCTVVRSVPGVGASILTAQTIGTSFADNTDHSGLIIINRALTEAETASVTLWANQKAGI